MVEPAPDRPAPPDGIDAEAYADARQHYLERKKAKTLADQSAAAARNKP